MNYTELEKKIADHVRATYAAAVEKQYPYHNLMHTIRVVEKSEEIARYYLLKEDELFIVRTAAWFHDIGHLSGGFEGHEQRGVVLMTSCLQSLDVPAATIGIIARCIMATRYPPQPKDLYEEILCDADSFHFGTEYFKQTDPAVKKEVEMRTGKIMTGWRNKTIHMLEHHRYFTSYCRQWLEEGKKENIRWLRSLPE